MTLDIKNVVVAGVSLFDHVNVRYTDCRKPNGSLGKAVIQHLQRASFNIALLTRNVEKTNRTFPDLTATYANYASVDELTEQLRSIGKHDAMVILINRDEIEAQINLVKAVVAAGIPHVIPSSFGLGISDPTVLALPPLHSKAKMEEFVREKANQGSLSFTCVSGRVIEAPS